MGKFKSGDKARVIDMREEHRHRIGEIATVGAMGGFNPDPMDVYIRFSDGTAGSINANQLEKVPN